MLLTKKDFLKVFPVPEIPAENDTDIAAEWLLNHGHKEPSQRVKAALKNVINTNTVAALLHKYMEQMRSQILSLDLENLRQLERTRTYFTFPIRYLQLDDHEINLLERTLNSLLKLKISKESLGPHEFLRTIGLDTDDFVKLEYEIDVIDRISSYAGVWNQSFMEQIDGNELSKKEMSNLRISEIFDIVVNYPNSICALQDLRQCISPSQRVQLVNAFTQSCNRRLLHAGTNTNDIILCYTSTIKSFIIIDPRGVLLDNASRPIRRYLKEREDTIPCIVNALLSPDEDNELSKLSEELTKRTAKPVDDLSLTWYPDPIDALPDFKKQDIIESLISIFDTKEVFITEFAGVFAESLLGLKNYDISEITLKLQLLKAKFGEGEFSSLDVMVRDIVDSKIINYKIHEKNGDISKALQFSILSYMYWPELPEDNFKLPEVINDQIKLYQNEFTTLKNGRKMNWVNAGVVSVELELKDRTLTFDVSPAKASVVYAFDGADCLESSQISEQLEMDENLVNDCLNFWTKNGVLKQNEDGSYFVLEEADPTSKAQIETTRDITPIKEAKLQSYWPFISGMLANIGPLSAEKIQSFLNATLPKSNSYNETIEELEKYLEECVQNEKLQNIDGRYKLVDNE